MARPKKRVIEYRSYDLPMEFPVIVLDGENWRISDVRSPKLHFHNCLEIGMCHTDSGIMEFGDVSREFRAGDVTVISANIPHTTYSTKGTASRWSYLFLDPEALMRVFMKGTLPEAEGFHRLVTSTCAILDRTRYPEIWVTVESIVREMNARERGWQFAVYGLLMYLCIMLIRIYDEPQLLKAEVPDNEAMAISPALEYIRSHYMDDFTIEELADLCHLSESHFRRLFRGIMDTGPLEYCNSVRIHAACHLLRMTKETVLSISEQVGFRSISSFNRHFQAVMHMKPMEWRRTNAMIGDASILEFSGWMEPERPSEQQGDGRTQ